MRGTVLASEVGRCLQAEVTTMMTMMKQIYLHVNFDVDDAAVAADTDDDDASTFLQRSLCQPCLQDDRAADSLRCCLGRISVLST